MKPLNTTVYWHPRCKKGLSGIFAALISSKLYAAAERIFTSHTIRTRICHCYFPDLTHWPCTAHPLAWLDLVKMDQHLACFIHHRPRHRLVPFAC
jgi:hypothetical protein